MTLAALAALLTHYGGGRNPAASEFVTPAPAADDVAAAAFGRHRAALEAACEASLDTADAEACARAWRRLRSAALWADRPDIAALADRPPGEAAEAGLARLSEIRRRS